MVLPISGLCNLRCLSTKGAKEDEVTMNAVYLELPVMAAARIKVADNTNIVISAGPYLAYGVGGKNIGKE